MKLADSLIPFILKWNKYGTANTDDSRPREFSQLPQAWSLFLNQNRHSQEW